MHAFNKVHSILIVTMFIVGSCWHNYNAGSNRRKKVWNVQGEIEVNIEEKMITLSTIADKNLEHRTLMHIHMQTLQNELTVTKQKCKEIESQLFSFQALH